MEDLEKKIPATISQREKKCAVYDWKKKHPANWALIVKTSEIGEKYLTLLSHLKKIYLACSPDQKQNSCITD